jgi:predicted DNA-binding transcriptional regulator
MVLHMLLGGMLGMVPGVKIMRVSQMRMMRSFMMIVSFMMFRGFGMVVCSHPVMMSRLLVMMRRFLRHREISIPLADSDSSVRKHVTNLHPRAIRDGLRHLQ